VIYYFLSKDEERRMLKGHPETYGVYMERTGMFLPKKIERRLSPEGVIGKIALFVLIAAFTIGGAFALRYYTIEHLPLWTSPNVVAIALLSDDTQKMEHRMNDILSMEEVKTRMKDNEKYLVYSCRGLHYAGTYRRYGNEWRLYHRHVTISRFIDWILHPFSHLSGHHSVLNHASHDLNQGVVRRLVFLKVSDGTIGEPYDFFSINGEGSLSLWWTWISII